MRLLFRARVRRGEQVEHRLLAHPGQPGYLTQRQTIMRELPDTLLDHALHCFASLSAFWNRAYASGASSRYGAANSSNALTQSE